MGDTPLTILAVDDDEIDLQTIERYLGQIPDLKTDLITCGTASDARETIQSRQIDIAVLDFQLGADNGLELLKAIRTSGATVPVIFLTGHGDERIAREVARAGGDDYLTKRELTPEVLQESITRVLEKLTADQAQLGFDQMLHQMANRDQVTGLLKRHAFIDALRLECARSERYERPLSLLLVDLDRFGAVNDQWGHEAGDQLLGSMAVTLRGILRSTDHFCRYEGDRFAVALTETGKPLAAEAAERLRAYIEATPFSAGSGGEVRLTCSVGVAFIEAKDANAERALIDAGAAIAEAKSLGGNTVVVSGG